MAIRQIPVRSELEVYRPTPPANHWSGLNCPARLFDTSYQIILVAAKAQCLDTPYYAQFPIALADIAQADVLALKKEPVIIERGVREACQIRINDRRVRRAGDRIQSGVIS